MQRYGFRDGHIHRSRIRLHNDSQSRILDGFELKSIIEQIGEFAQKIKAKSLVRISTGVFVALSLGIRLTRSRFQNVFVNY